MTKSQDEYQICQAAFTVPDEQAARRIFQEALELRLFTKTGLAYWINSIAVLFCKAEQKMQSSSKLYLCASSNKIEEIAKKLEGGPEKIILDKRVLSNGKMSYTLQIRTTIGSYIVLTNRGR